MLNAETTININAEPEQAWPILKDLKNFHLWNERTSFTVDDKQGVIVGNKVLMRVKLFGFWLNVPVTIQTMDEENGLRWVGGIPGIYRGSHYFYFKKEDEKTVFVQGEDFKGLLVPLMWPFLKKELNRLYESGNQSFANYIKQQNL